MKKKGGRESVHQKHLRVLREARVKDVTEGSKVEESQNIEPVENKHEPFLYTFNWKDRSAPVLVPRLVAEGETESLRKEFINSVATGKSTVNLDRRVLKELSAEQIFADINDGIHRWHPASKER